MDGGRLSCRDVVELVTDYLDDALPPPVRVCVEGHLDRCPGCTAYVDQVRTVSRTLGSAPAPLDPAWCARLLAAFRDWSAGAR